MLRCCFPFLYKKQQKFRFISHQNYGIPYSIIYYCIIHGQSSIQLKLYKTCKILKKKIQDIQGFQVDKLVIKKICWLAIDQKVYKPEIFLEKNKITFITDLDDKHLSYDRPLKIKALEIEDLDIRTATNLHTKLDLSKLEELILFRMEILGDEQIIKMEILEPYLSPIVRHLDLSYLYIVDGNLLKSVLTKMSNLKFLHFCWQENVTSLNCFPKCPRAVKLENICINFISKILEVEEITNFILHFMAPNGSLKLCFRFNISPDFAQQILQNLKEKNIEFEKFNLQLFNTF